MNYEPTEEERRLYAEKAAEELEAREKREAEELDLADTWKPIDLTEALAGLNDDPPSLLARVDGKHLLYPGKMHWFLGEPESLKSWLAQVAVAQALDLGRNVLYVDFEDTENGVIGRLLAMGVQEESIRTHFYYLRPNTPIGDGKERVTAAQLVFEETLRAAEYDLAILDGVTESLATEGLDANSNSEVADWLGRIPRKMSRTGAAMVCIDHVTKAVDGRGRYAIGAQHKLAGLDGISLNVTLLSPLGRATTEDITGRAKLTVGKDRPGWVRSIAEDRKEVGTLEITSHPDGRVSAGIVTEVMEAAPPFEAISEVMQQLERFGGEDSETHLVKHCDIPEAETVNALRWLLDAGWVEAGKKGNSTIYMLTGKGEKEWES